MANSGTSCVRSWRPCVLGTPRSPADQRCGHAALSPQLLMESWRTEAAVLLGAKGRHLCPDAHRGLLKARSLPHPPGTRKGVQRGGRRGRLRSGGAIRVLPRLPWRPWGGEEAWQPAAGKMALQLDRDSAPAGPMGRPQKRRDENGLRVSPELRHRVDAETRPHSARAPCGKAPDEPSPGIRRGQSHGWQGPRTDKASRGWDQVPLTPPLWQQHAPLRFKS